MTALGRFQQYGNRSFRPQTGTTLWVRGGAAPRRGNVGISIARTLRAEKRLRPRATALPNQRDSDEPRFPGRLRERHSACIDRRRCKRALRPDYPTTGVIACTLTMRSSYEALDSVSRSSSNVRPDRRSTSRRVNQHDQYVAFGLNNHHAFGHLGNGRRLDAGKSGHEKSRRSPFGRCH